MFLSVWMLSLSVFATVQAVQANNPLLSLQSLQKEVQQHCTTHCLALLHADEMCKPFCQFSQHVAEEHFLEIKEDLNRVRDGNKNELIEWAVKDVVASKFERKTMDDSEAIMRLVEEVAGVVAGTLAFHDEL